MHIGDYKIKLLKFYHISIKNSTKTLDLINKNASCNRKSNIFVWSIAFFYYFLVKLRYNQEKICILNKQNCIKIFFCKSKCYFALLLIFSYANVFGFGYGNCLFGVHKNLILEVKELCKPCLFLSFVYLIFLLIFFHI